MMGFKTAYWDDLAAREAFRTFILEIHNLNFQPLIDAASLKGRNGRMDPLGRPGLKRLDRVLLTKKSTEKVA